ncbi:MAG: hypothetical protein IJ796_04815 [Lachnospiraceae bacterium]|nr:hypothetical protein [Lachnospiraceae bacterium]
MKRQKYIFTNKKHPLIAIMSTILGGISVLSYVFVIVRSYMLKGDVPASFGIGAVLTLVYSVVGMILGLYSFKLKDSFHLFSVAGCVLNGIALLAAAFILWIPD